MTPEKPPAEGKRSGTRSEEAPYYYTLYGITNTATISEWQARIYAGAEEAKPGGTWKTLEGGIKVSCPEPQRITETRIDAARRSIQTQRMKAKQPSELDFDWEPGRGLVPRNDEEN